MKTINQTLLIFLCIFFLTRANIASANWDTVAICTEVSGTSAVLDKKSADYQHRLIEDGFADLIFVFKRNGDQWDILTGRNIGEMASAVFHDGAKLQVVGDDRSSVEILLTHKGRLGYGLEVYSLSVSDDGFGSMSLIKYKNATTKYQGLYVGQCGGLAK